MADPLTIATIGGLGLQAVSSVAGAQGAHEANATEQERKANVNQDLNTQNQRLLAGPVGPPTEYGQQVQGYGYADENGQYAPVQSGTPAPQVDPQVMAAANAGMPPQVDPYQAAMMAQQPQVMMPQQMMTTPLPAAQMFGIPVWFDDGQQNG